MGRSKKTNVRLLALVLLPPLSAALAEKSTDGTSTASTMITTTNTQNETTLSRPNVNYWATSTITLSVLPSTTSVDLPHPNYDEKEHDPKLVGRQGEGGILDAVTWDTSTATSSDYWWPYPAYTDWAAVDSTTESVASSAQLEGATAAMVVNTTLNTDNVTVTPSATVNLLSSLLSPSTSASASPTDSVSLTLITALPPAASTSALSSKYIDSVGPSPFQKLLPYLIPVFVVAGFLVGVLFSWAAWRFFQKRRQAKEGGLAEKEGLLGGGNGWGAGEGWNEAGHSRANSGVDNNGNDSVREFAVLGRPTPSRRPTSMIRRVSRSQLTRQATSASDRCSPFIPPMTSPKNTYPAAPSMMGDGDGDDRSALLASPYFASPPSPRSLRSHPQHSRAVSYSREHDAEEDITDNRGQYDSARNKSIRLRIAERLGLGMVLSSEPQRKRTEESDSELEAGRGSGLAGTGGEPSSVPGSGFGRRRGHTRTDTDFAPTPSRYAPVRPEQDHPVRTGWWGLNLFGSTTSSAPVADKFTKVPARSRSSWLANGDTGVSLGRGRARRLSDAHLSQPILDALPSTPSQIASPALGRRLSFGASDFSLSLRDPGDTEERGRPKERHAFKNVDKSASCPGVSEKRLNKLRTNRRPSSPRPSPRAPDVNNDCKPPTSPRSRAQTFSSTPLPYTSSAPSSTPASPKTSTSPNPLPSSAFSTRARGRSPAERYAARRSAHTKVEAILSRSYSTGTISMPTSPTMFGAVVPPVPKLPSLCLVGSSDAHSSLPTLSYETHSGESAESDDAVSHHHASIEQKLEAVSLVGTPMMGKAM